MTSFLPIENNPSRILHQEIGRSSCILLPRSELHTQHVKVIDYITHSSLPSWLQWNLLFDNTIFCTVYISSSLSMNHQHKQILVFTSDWQLKTGWANPCCSVTNNCAQPTMLVLLPQYEEFPVDFHSYIFINLVISIFLNIPQYLRKVDKIIILGILQKR